MDAARTAKREKAAKVTVIFRETEDKVAALPSEVEVAKKEGITFMGLRSPVKFVGDTKVTGVECEIREVHDDKAVGTGEFETIPANKVIIAIGQKPAGRIIATTRGIEVNEGGFVKTKDRPYGMSTRHGIFSGGDVVHGPATVVRAMKDAKKVAAGIAQYVEAKKLMEECGLKIKE
jgi:glutamate synthase (NADPH/NADH) small chain